MMKEWVLDTIYPSIDSHEYKKDIETLKELITKFNEFSNTMNNENVEGHLVTYLNLTKQYMEIVRKLYGYNSLRTSIHTDDIEAIKQMAMIESIMNDGVEANTKINAWISQQDFSSFTHPLIQEHLFILNEAKEQVKYQLSEKEEMIIAMMKQTGSTSFERLKDELIANHTVELNGETLSLTQVLNKAYDGDKNVRKEAYEAEIQSYKKIEDGLAACLNGIKGEVLTVCKLRGYESPLEMTLLDSRMDKETLDAMLCAMKEYLPAFRAYMKAKAEALGYSNGLPFYEMYAPVTSDKKVYSYEEGCEYILKQFKKFDDDLYEMAKKAMENGWIDVESRPGKVSGAFCAGVPSLKESRILLNYSYSFDSITTLSHELGHAYHNECAKNESILNLSSPMPLAETASTFNETILKKAALKELSDQEALAVLEAEISGCNQVIVDIYSRYLFETELFAQRRNGPLTAKEICALMENAQIESYGDGLDPNYRHPYMWTWKPHYYYADANFYNFPYAFGQLFAKGLYAIYLENKDAFVPVYKKLLASTGKMNIADVCASVGINVRDVNFWRASLQMIKEDIDLFIELLKK